MSNVDDRLQEKLLAIEMGKNQDSSELVYGDQRRQ